MKGDLSWVVIAGAQKEEWAGRLLSREAGGFGDGRIWKRIQAEAGLTLMFLICVTG